MLTDNDSRSFDAVFLWRPSTGGLRSVKKTLNSLIKRDIILFP